MTEREQYYNKIVYWIAFAPITIVMGLGAIVAWNDPSLFGF